MFYRQRWLISLIFLFLCGVCFAQESGDIILFQRGTFYKPILKYTGSDYSHVAIVLGDEVFEATWPKVKKTPLAEYIEFMNKRLEKRLELKLWILSPNRKFCDCQIETMKEHAESQLGKPYRVRSWWLDRPGKGLHCSQYLSLVLGQIDDTFKRDNHWKVSPVDIYNMAQPSYKVTQFKND